MRVWWLLPSRFSSSNYQKSRTSHPSICHQKKEQGVKWMSQSTSSENLMASFSECRLKQPKSSHCAFFRFETLYIKISFYYSRHFFQQTFDIQNRTRLDDPSVPCFWRMLFDEQSMGHYSQSQGFSALHAALII